MFLLFINLKQIPGSHFDALELLQWFHCCILGCTGTYLHLGGFPGTSLHLGGVSGPTLHFRVEFGDSGS